MARPGLVTLNASFLALLATAVASLDWWAAVSLDGKFHAVASAVAFGLTAPGFLVSRDPRCLLPLVAFLLFLAVLPFVALSPVKPFHEFHADISPEMTDQEVRQRLDVHFPDGGRFAKPVCTKRADGCLHFFLDPYDSRYDAETVTVTFTDNGYSWAKVYLPD
jgi:hypothetical protein